MRGRREPLPVSLLVAFALATAAPAQEVAVSADIAPTLTGIGQFVTLTVEASVEGGIELELEPEFSLENLELVAGPSQSQQVSFVNGRVSRSQTLSWTFRAQDEGSARIQGLQLTVNGELFELAEQVVEVQRDPIEQIDPFGRTRRFSDPFEDFFDPAWRRRRAAPSEDPKLFLRAEVTPRDPYVGQQVLYSLLLFTQTDIGSVSPQEMPDFKGLWTVEIEQPQRPKSVMTEVQGERYGRVVLLQRALFPLQPGQLRLDPVEARLIAKVPDYSWMGMVGSYDKEFNLASNAVTLDVKALPTPAPADFKGAVGDLGLELKLEPQEIEVGEAATLTLTLSGKGNVDGLAGPDVPELDGMRVFPPQQSGGNRAVGTTVRGDKSWSYVLVPGRAGVWEIPVAPYSYFNPRTEQYETVAAQSRVLVARKTGAEPRERAAPGGAPRNPTAAPSVKTGVENGLEVDRVPSLSSAWLKIGLPLLALVLAVPYARKAVDRWQATSHLRARLKTSAEVAKPRAAAQAIEEAWREFLNERWQVSPSTVAGDWPAQLSDLGLPESTLAEVSRLVDDLHYLRYAPELSAQDSLKEDLVDRSRRLGRLLA